MSRARYPHITRALLACRHEIWGYVGGGGFTATSGRTEGAITLAAGSENHAGDWPLHAGRWVAWFLVNDGDTSVASVEFTVL
jgi:hypothetical protein